jgi:hypothetical protein
MADPTPTDPKTPAAEPADETQDIKPAQHHHKDKGKVVSTAFGEKMSGGIADISDGDD